MNTVDFLIKSYRKLYDGLVPSWLLSLSRFVHRSVSNIIIPLILKRQSHIKQRYKKRIPNLIVSFTSFPARIDNVWMVVECMLRQSVLPEKVILWLSKDQFPNEHDIPECLKKRQNEIFEIRMVDGDIRSHKKYYYVINEHPDILVFLIDDDIFYPSDILERSYNEYLKGEAQVICNYGYEIQYNSDKKMLPYLQWKRLVKQNSSPFLFFGSGGGTLIDVSKLIEKSKEIDLAMRLVQSADDIWLNAMVRLSKMRVTMLSNGALLLVNSQQSERLAASNVYNNENDKQLGNLIDYMESSMSINPFAFEYFDNV